jgi:hypothetical protein
VASDIAWQRRTEKSVNTVSYLSSPEAENEDLKIENDPRPNNDINTDLLQVIMRDLKLLWNDVRNMKTSGEHKKNGKIAAITGDGHGLPFDLCILPG